MTITSHPGHAIKIIYKTPDTKYRISNQDTSEDDDNTSNKSSRTEDPSSMSDFWAHLEQLEHTQHRAAKIRSSLSNSRSSMETTTIPNSRSMESFYRYQDSLSPAADGRKSRRYSSSSSSQSSGGGYYNLESDLEPEWEDCSRYQHTLTPRGRPSSSRFLLSTVDDHYATTSRVVPASRKENLLPEIHGRRSYVAAQPPPNHDHYQRLPLPRQISNPEPRSKSYRARNVFHKSHSSNELKRYEVPHTVHRSFNSMEDIDDRRYRSPDLLDRQGNRLSAGDIESEYQSPDRSQQSDYGYQSRNCSSSSLDDIQESSDIIVKKPMYQRSISRKKILDSLFEEPESCASSFDIKPRFEISSDSDTSVPEKDIGLPIPAASALPTVHQRVRKTGQVVSRAHLVHNLLARTISDGSDIGDIVDDIVNDIKAANDLDLCHDVIPSDEEDMFAKDAKWLKEQKEKQQEAVRDKSDINQVARHKNVILMIVDMDEGNIYISGDQNLQICTYSGK